MHLSLIEISLRHSAYQAQRFRLRALVRQACEAVLKAEGVAGALSIALMDDAQVSQLNHDFRGKDKPTNVLAFPSGEGGYLGDIAISLDTVAAEALEQGKKPADHLMHLTVHGVLHLLGHDHKEEGQAEAMEAKEITILESLGVKNPYLLF